MSGKTAVRQTLLDERWASLPVTAALLFMSDDNWPLLQMRPLRFGDVYVLWGKAPGKFIREPGPIAAEDIAGLERVLAEALPSA